MEKQIAETAKQIWAMISEDVVPDGKSISREDVIAIVADQFEFNAPREIAIYFSRLTHERQATILKEAFPRGFSY